jgi:lysophospholipase L1-like esterase
MTQPFRYVALGDSTGIGIGAERDGGYVDRLAQRLSGWVEGLSVENLCRTGATTGDVLATQVPRALELSPALVTLVVGISDVVHGLPDEAFAVNLEEIAVSLARFRAKVVMTNIPNLALSPMAARVPRSIYENRIEVFNEHAFATARRHGFTFVDLFEMSRAALPGHPELFCPDGFHPSGEGYEQWAELLWPAVCQHLPGRGAAPRGS